MLIKLKNEIINNINIIPRTGLEPVNLYNKALLPQSSVFTNFTISVKICYKNKKQSFTI